MLHQVPDLTVALYMHAEGTWCKQAACASSLFPLCWFLKLAFFKLYPLGTWDANCQLYYGYLLLATHCLHCSSCGIFMYIAVICAEFAPALQKYKLIPFSDKVRTVYGQGAGLEPPISLPCSTTGFLCHYLSSQCDRSPSLKWGVISFSYLIINSEHPNPNRFTLTPSLSIANFYSFTSVCHHKKKKKFILEVLRSLISPSRC